jgi:signal transduction histidine kinase
VASLIDRQENLSVALIIIVLASAVAVIVVIFVWNSRLEQTVRARTAELSAANEQLLTHDRLQKEFINIAAHELRTPIQPLLGVAEMLEHQFKDDARQEITISKPEVDMIMRNASRLANLSAGILEVSRIESNTLKLTREPIDLKAKLETIVHDMQSILPPERNIKLRIESRGVGSNQPVLVTADRERLYEVISNLLSNAIKFTPVGEITVILEPGENEAEVAVKVVDTGRGIDPEMLPRLFTKFATNSEMGTGLGLYIAKSIIEAHGGKIWAKNNDDGKGATFAFSLPIIQAPTLE